MLLAAWHPAAKTSAVLMRARMSREDLHPFANAEIWAVVLIGAFLTDAPVSAAKKHLYVCGSPLTESSQPENPHITIREWTAHQETSSSATNCPVFLS
jgi:hypothetical protein